MCMYQMHATPALPAPATWPQPEHAQHRSSGVRHGGCCISSLHGSLHSWLHGLHGRLHNTSHAAAARTQPALTRSFRRRLPTCSRPVLLGSPRTTHWVRAAASHCFPRLPAPRRGAVTRRRAAPAAPRPLPSRSPPPPSAPFPHAAQYKPDTFEALAHRQTVDKLVKAFGYPQVGASRGVGWGGVGGWGGGAPLCAGAAAAGHGRWHRATQTRRQLLDGCPDERQALRGHSS